MTKKKTKSNVVAHVVKQGGDRQGHNLFLQGEIGGIPIMLRLEPIVKRGGAEDLVLTNVVLQNRAGIKKRMDEMVENGEIVAFDESVARTFDKKGSTQITRTVRENQRPGNAKPKVEEPTEDVAF